MRAPYLPSPPTLCAMESNDVTVPAMPHAPRKVPSVSVPAEHAGDFDVVVAGAGFSGVVAAVAAARAGARVVLIESQPFIGGNGSFGLPLSSYRAATSEHLVVGGLPLELAQRLERRGGIDMALTDHDWIMVNPEAVEAELLAMIRESGVELVTYSPLLAASTSGAGIDGVYAYNRDGAAMYFGGKFFVDATGDAHLSQLAGVRTVMGRQRDGLTQSMSLVFTMAGVDESHAPGPSELARLWDEQIDRGVERRNTRRSPSSSRVVGKPGWRMFIVTRILVEKGTDNRLLTQAEIEGRAQIDEFVEEFLKPHVPGYESAYLAGIASRVGVRETRRLVGVYELDDDDVLAGRRFEDSIACNSMSIENHSPDSGDVEWTHLEPGSYYTVPYRSLVAADAPNLLACGRCMSASHEALAAVRVLTISMATGEAAGAAAALCATGHSDDARKLAPDLLRRHLVDGGAIVD